MKSSNEKSGQRFSFRNVWNRVTAWWDEYQIFFATVLVLIGAHFAGEVLKLLADVLCDLINANWPNWQDALRTGIASFVAKWWQIMINAVVGFILCWPMYYVLTHHPLYKSKRKQRVPAERAASRTWVKRLRDFPRKSPLTIVVFSTLFLVLVELTIHSLDSSFHGDVGWHLVWVLVLFLAVIVLAPAAHALTFVNIELEEASSVERKLLIMFLSDTDHPAPALPNGNSLLKHRSSAEDYQTLATYPPGGERWNWEPCLRGIEKHARLLERLYIVASTQSARLVNAFCKHIEAYQRNGALKPALEVFAVDHQNPAPVKINLEALASASGPSLTGIDFEHYKQIESAIKSAVHHANDEAQTVLDITGGQKPNSLVGGIMTIGTKVFVQYVQTGHQKRSVFYYIAKTPNLVA